MRKTVFVVGAGASSELNLPTGAELKSQIGDLLKFSYSGSGQIKQGDEHIYSAMRTVIAEGDAMKKCKRIINGLPMSPSIDNFINAHKNDKDIAFIGKLAMVRPGIVGD